jgi:hypothetical protein
VFPATVREQECTFPTVMQYFTYCTILHGCKIWTIKQMRYKKSKDGRGKFMGRTVGYTLLLHRKNKSTLKNPVEGKRCSDIKNSLKIVKKLKVLDFQNNFFLSTSHKM